jgi:hypothetical protein
MRKRADFEKAPASPGEGPFLSGVSPKCNCAVVMLRALIVTFVCRIESYDTCTVCGVKMFLEGLFGR